MSSTGATLSGSFYGATGRINSTGIVWGSDSALIDNPDANEASLGWAYDSSCIGETASGNISCTVETLEATTTYYYRAFVAEYNAATSEYEYRYGGIVSFTTDAASVSTGYLSCNEVPAVSGILNGNGDSGTLTDRDDEWYRYYTGNAKRQIAVHTYTHPDTGKRLRSYTVLYDESKYAPLWTAHAMHASMWPDRNVGRNDGWMSDPAISLTQQNGLDNASTVGYSKGHLVASNYRQSTVKQNKQTFYNSNQAPQWQNNFNSGVWSNLEEKVAANAPTSNTDTLYVVTGVLYEGSVSTLPSGSLNVPVPSHFYKCLMKCRFDGTNECKEAYGIAYIFTNEAHAGAHYYDAEFVTTIDAVEERAGFEFFPNLPASAKATATPLWEN